MAHVHRRLLTGQRHFIAYMYLHVVSILNRLPSPLSMSRCAEPRGEHAAGLLAALPHAGLERHLHPPAPLHVGPSAGPAASPRRGGLARPRTGTGYAIFPHTHHPAHHFIDHALLPSPQTPHALTPLLYSPQACPLLPRSRACRPRASVPRSPSGPPPRPAVHPSGGAGTSASNPRRTPPTS